MPRNDDGEFELILGNRQLMSVFFIVVILLGVFFAMGYIVGRNASPVGAPDVASHRPEPKIVDGEVPSTRESTRETARETARDAEPAAPNPADSQRKETTSQQGPAAKPAPQPERAPVKTPSRAAAAAQPESGRTYLQISAVDHDKAEIYVELLHKKNFSAIAAEIPEKPGVFRVLVGPIADADVNKTRSDLQNANFPGKEAVKRTF